MGIQIAEKQKKPTQILFGLMYIVKTKGSMVTLYPLSLNRDLCA